MHPIRVPMTMGSNSRSLRVLRHGRDNDSDKRKERKRGAASE